MRAIKELKKLGYRVYLKNNKIFYQYTGNNTPHQQRVQPLIRELIKKKAEAVKFLEADFEEFLKSLDNFITPATNRLFFCEGRKR